jgi:hypothetical protein
MRFSREFREEGPTSQDTVQDNPYIHSRKRKKITNIVIITKEGTVWKQ